MAEETTKREASTCRALSFPVRLRSAGGSGRSLQLTIPKDVTDYLDLKEGDFIKCAVHKLDK